MPDAGILYVLTNSFMPGLVKIGCTTATVEERIKQLSAGTGVPVAFHCHFAAWVDDMAVKEKTLHQLFSDKRVNPNREFFQVASEKIVLAIRMGAFTEVTPGRVDIPKAEERALEKAEEADTKKRGRINLAAICIQPGATLTLSRDEDVHAIVFAGNKVEYQGEITSLSQSAVNALQKLGYRTKNASGSDYWMYEGKTLDEIRIAKETEEESVA